MVLGRQTHLERMDKLVEGGLCVWMPREREAERGGSHRKTQDGSSLISVSTHSHHLRGVVDTHVPNVDNVWKT